MGVQARIVLWAGDEARARSAARAAFARLAAVDDALSDWRADGELARLEARAGGPPLPVSEDLYRCLERALAVARASDGAFDPSVGALTRLWRAARASGVAPTAEALAAAREATGWRHVELDPVTRGVRLARADLRLDFGGIGKGYGADRALETLRGHGVERALVGLAGDHAVGAPPPGARAWRLRAGRDDEAAPTLELERCGVATSGDTEQFFVLDGVRTSHVLDPRTGIGVVARPLVTVVAPDCATADALASALGVVGPEGAEALLARFPGARARLQAP